MLVVKVELWPHGFGDEYVRTIATMVIANVGGTSDLGDYAVSIAHDGKQPIDPHALFARFAKRAELKEHPRLKEHVWALVAKSLQALGFLGADVVAQFEKIARGLGERVSIEIEGANTQMSVWVPGEAQGRFIDGVPLAEAVAKLGGERD